MSQPMAGGAYVLRLVISRIHFRGGGREVESLRAVLTTASEVLARDSYIWWSQEGFSAVETG